MTDLEIDGRTIIRSVFACCLLFSLGIVGMAGIMQDTGTGDIYAEQKNLPYGDREEIVPPSDNITVVAAHPSNRLMAFSPDGRLLYYDDEYDRYHDVDPVNDESATVEFVGAKYLKGAECGAVAPCTKNFVERVNLTTGETTRIYTQKVPRRTGESHRWHDVDRIDDYRLLVADIQNDRVFIINMTADEVTYEWSAIDEFPTSGGGPWPDDWTHLNDVELLTDGRIMVSLRNQDSVVFLTPGEGLQESWTLGEEDTHSILYEQHNPDYISSEQGGPAVIVADSENNRLIEYQRRNGSWEQSWVWSDEELSWARDADRLTNGHTLIGGTHGSRIIEVDESGNIVWKANSIQPYDVERLDTGEESAGGQSADQLDLESKSGGQGKSQDSMRENGMSVKAFVGAPGRLIWGLFPAKVQHAIQFVAPVWMGKTGLGYSIVAIVSGMAWVLLEIKWAGYGIRLRTPQQGD